MKTIKFFLIGFLTIFCATIIAQTDTLYLKNGETIAGIKITKITSMNIWYTQNKIGKNVPSKEVLKHTFKVEDFSQSQIVKTAVVINNNAEITSFILKTFSIFGIAFRKKEVDFRKTILTKGFKIKEIYSLPEVGFIFYIGKTIYLVEKN